MSHQRLYTAGGFSVYGLPMNTLNETIIRLANRVEKQAPKLRVYDLEVDGHHVTCIDSTGKTPEQAEADFIGRFGAGRVGSVALKC